MRAALRRATAVQALAAEWLEALVAERLEALVAERLEALVAEPLEAVAAERLEALAEAMLVVRVVGTLEVAPPEEAVAQAEELGWHSRWFRWRFRR